MKRVALILLAACGSRAAPPPPPPAVLVDDGHDCPGGPLDVAPDCRQQGVADLDGDGTADCWRTRDAGELQLLIWPHCEGEPQLESVAWDAEMTLAVPAGYARGVATLFGYREPEEAPPPPEDPPKGWGIDGRLELAWQDGTPVAAPADADYAGDAVTIRDPSFDTPGIDQAPRLAATCADWEVWTSAHDAAVVDRAQKRWARLPLRSGPASCDDVVRLGGFTIDPRTGQYATHPLRDASVLTRTDLHDVEPCPAGPLLELPPDTPCTRESQVPRDAMRGDCFSLRRAVDTQTIELDAQPGVGCKGAPVHLSIPISGEVSLVSFDGNAISWRWLANLLAPRAGCLPKRKRSTCPVPDPAVIWMHSRLVHQGGQGLGSGLSPPVWQPGHPTLPGASATLTYAIPGFDRDATLLLHHPTDRRPLAIAGECTRWEVWTSPAGGAIVDKKTHQWMWGYLASESFARLDGTGPAPLPVLGGSCNDVTVSFDLGDRRAIVDPKTGRWVIRSAPAKGAP